MLDQFLARGKDDGVKDDGVRRSAVSGKKVLMQYLAVHSYMQILFGVVISNLLSSVSL